jgi:hypothetical protein
MAVRHPEFSYGELSSIARSLQLLLDSNDQDPVEHPLTEVQRTTLLAAQDKVVTALRERERSFE